MQLPGEERIAVSRQQLDGAAFEQAASPNGNLDAVDRQRFRPLVVSLANCGRRSGPGRFDRELDQPRRRLSCLHRVGHDVCPPAADEAGDNRATLDAIAGLVEQVRLKKGHK